MQHPLTVLAVTKAATANAVIPGRAPELGFT